MLGELKMGTAAATTELTGEGRVESLTSWVWVMPDEQTAERAFGVPADAAFGRCVQRLARETFAHNPKLASLDADPLQIADLEVAVGGDGHVGYLITAPSDAKEQPFGDLRMALVCFRVGRVFGQVQVWTVGAPEAAELEAMVRPAVDRAVVALAHH